MWKTLRKILKFLPKVAAGFVIIVLILLISIHLPPVQNSIAKKVSSYLSKTTNGEVVIERIRFSLLGKIEILGLEINDPNRVKIFEAGRVALESNIFQLLKGDLILENVEIDDLHGHLIKKEEELNIKYFIYAFKSDSPQLPDTKKQGFQIQFDRISIRNLHFEYLSETDSLDLRIELPLFQAGNAGLSINPNKIYIDTVLVENARYDLIIQNQKISTQDPSNSLSAMPPLDFGSGFDFVIRHFELRNNGLSLHLEDISRANKFDPAHLDISNLDLTLDSLSMNKDALVATLHDISMKLPGFTIKEFRSGINVNSSGTSIWDLSLSSDRSTLELDLVARYQSWPELLNELKESDVELTIGGHIDKQDLFYFLNDSIPKSLKNWSQLEFESNAKYSSGSTEIKSLSIVSNNSSVFIKGTILKLLDIQNTKWKDLEIQSMPGTDFKNILLPLLGDPRIPDHLQIQLVSSGDLSKFSINGLLNTSWGNIKTLGSAGFNRSNLLLDLNIDGYNIHLGEITELNWLGPAEMSIHANGSIGKSSDLQVEGSISSIEIIGKPVRDIDLVTNLRPETLLSSFTIKDPYYQSVIDSEISLSDSIDVSALVRLDHFRLGKLFDLDTSLILTGIWSPKIHITQSELGGSLEGYGIEFETSEINYPLDTLQIKFKNSATASSIEFATEGIFGQYSANFDIQQVAEVFNTYMNHILDMSRDTFQVKKDRSMHVELILDNQKPFELAGIDIGELSGLNIKGSIDEGKQSLELYAHSEHFKGYSISLDTILINVKVEADSIYSSLFINNLLYDSIHLGNLKYLLLGNRNTLFSNLLLTRDSSSLFGIQSNLKPEAESLWIYPENLVLFNNKYIVDKNNPIQINDKNVKFRQFNMESDQSVILIDGDLNNFTLSITNGDLKRFNSLLSDTATIQKGYLNGTLAYNKLEQFIDLQVKADSLTIFDYPPIQLLGIASTNGSDVPFQFKMNSASNNLGLAGRYSFETSRVDAKLDVDVNDLRMFEIISTNFLDEISGKVKGNATIGGLINEPKIDGSIRLLDVNLVTSDPRAVIGIEDEVITLDNSGVYLQDFSIYDQNRNPLTINGFFKTENFQNFNYELFVNTENYVLINNPKKGDNLLQGILIIGGDFKVKGNEKDTYVDADITIRDETDLDYVTPLEDIELITSDGIVEFVDISQPLDSTITTRSQLYYDSLISSLPTFELNSTLAIEDYAILRFIIDPRSGDLIEASGNANLEIGRDRTGNISLSGIYTINKGLYKLSFYDIVKKEFTIVPGATINWNGDPYSGEINVTAKHIIKTSSSGLIGHEIGENEKDQYRRPLPYEVGIIISGQIDRPEVSFSLDLPAEDKTNFPALASKLSRLKQPEYESELNKQVFGLLVLGGFIPETSGSELDQSLIATTAISNSVNSILTSQLNRFTNKYVKNVDIDVGLQSYSDFSGGSGQTRTAMDFRVTKRMMDDRLSFEIGGGVDINTDQSGPNTGSDNFRGDVAIIYDLTESGNKQLKAFNNESYDIIYHQIRNTGVSLIFIKEFDKKEH